MTLENDHDLVALTFMLGYQMVGDHLGIKVNPGYSDPRGAQQAPISIIADCPPTLIMTHVIRLLGEGEKHMPYRSTMSYQENFCLIPGYHKYLLLVMVCGFQE